MSAVVKCVNFERFKLQALMCLIQEVGAHHTVVPCHFGVRCLSLGKSSRECGTCKKKYRCFQA